MLYAQVVEEKMIFTRHSVLKRGCSTWNRQEMPEHEFHSRVDYARRQMAERDLAALVIYGDNYSFADLCYLTNYFPKVRGGIAVIAREGPLSLLLNIGSRDVPFAKTLTWVEDVRASNQLGRDGAELLTEKGFGKAKIGLVDSGKGFPLPQWEQMKAAVPQAQWQTCDALFQQPRLYKGPRELAAMRAAGRLLGEICKEMEHLIRQGATEYQVVAAIDRLARDKGVEDIRMLAGAARLQPQSRTMTARVADHWAVYLAIQHERYWVETGRTYLSANSALQAAYGTAREMVAATAARLRPMQRVAAIDDAARAQLGEFYAGASLYGLGNGLGLSPWEAPFLNEADARAMGSSYDPSMVLQENMTLGLRVAFAAEGKLILFGDTFELTSGGPVSLVAAR
jgi:Xaa-Pro aminopeptidase